MWEQMQEETLILPELNAGVIFEILVFQINFKMHKTVQYLALKLHCN